LIISKLHIDNNSESSLEQVREKLLKLTAGNYRVYICDDKRQRSLEQNAYYWGVVVKMISDHTGYNSDEVHMKLCFLFNSEFLEVKGKHYRQGRTTTKLNTKEFTEYLEQIRIWASTELWIDLPEPGEFSEDQQVHFDSEHK
jgi:hypothetical protein